MLLRALPCAGGSALVNVPAKRTLPTALAVLSLLVPATLAGIAAPEAARAHGNPTPLGRPVFTNATAEVGLGGFLNGGSTGGPGDPPFFVELNGPGACWLDFDADEDLDLYLVATKHLRHPEKNARRPASALYRNDGGVFADVSAASGTDVHGTYQGCAAADYDGDGRKDLYVTGYGGGALFRNRGDGTFENRTAAAGVANARCGAFPCWGSSASWLDYDADGCLDLFIANFADYETANHTGNGPAFVPGQKPRLYHATCDGAFEDKTAFAGLADRRRHTWQSVAADLTGDGRTDLFLANDGEEDDLYVNDGDGTFTHTMTALVDPRSGMGADVGDLNGDLKPDVVVTNFIQETNGIFVSNGPDWIDVGAESPFDNALPYSGWGARIFDYNNDGWQDLWVVNGMTEWTGAVEVDEPMLLYENVDGSEFRDVSDDVGPAFRENLTGRGGAWGDYDNDGDVDAIVTEAGEQPTHLYRADFGPGNFLNVDLVGTASGVTREAAGAKVTVRSGGLHDQRQEKVLGAGFLGSNDPRLHFGLATEESADVTVLWPDGSTQQFPGIRANSFVRLVQGASAPTVLRENPLVRIDAPTLVERLDPVTFTASLAPGATLASVAWDFADGATAAGASATHAFTDVGTHVVRATATDSLGRAKTQTLRVLVTDDLEATVAFEAPWFLPTDTPTGTVTVRFSNGDPVRGATVALEVTHSMGADAADAAVARLPKAVRTLAGQVTLWANGTTDADGRFAFALPPTFESPSPFVDASAMHPGVYTGVARGGARGVGYPDASGSFGVLPGGLA